MDLSPSTWRALGLSVALGYACLGTFALTAPKLAAQLFNLHPYSVSPSSTTRPSTKLEPTHPTPTPVSASPEGQSHASAIETSMLLLGARDLSVGIALLAFDQLRMPRAMGVLILSGMVLCGMDVYWIWKLRGRGWGTAFSVGAASWGLVGLGLLEVRDGW